MVFNNLSIRLKLVIGFLAASMIPFLFVSIFAVVYFQSDKETDIINKLKSDLGVQTKFVKSKIEDALGTAEGLGFQNNTTKDAAEKFFRNPPREEDDIERIMVADEYAAYFNQYLKGDIVRIVLVMNAMDKDDQVIGEVVYSVRKMMKGGKAEVVEDSLALKDKLNNSLYLRKKDGNALSQAYYAGRSRKQALLNEFSTFDNQYAFFITAPIMQPEGFALNIPNIDRSVEPKPAEDSSDAIIGVVLIQIVPASLQATIGDYHGLGETYLVGENAKAEKVLHSVVAELRNKNGTIVKPGDPVPDDVVKTLSQSGLTLGENRLTIHTNLEFPGVKWYLLADINTDRVFAPVKQLRNLFLVIGLLGFAIILVVVIFLANSFANPLKKLAHDLKQIKNTGDFTRRSEIRGRDEMGQTIAAVNELMESLQAAFSNINRVMEAVARGDLSQRITGAYQGSIEELKGAINQSLDILCLTMKKVLRSANRSIAVQMS
ncbi:methyl-accepting chemotaxis protein [bacterium]|nr:methyl-accepting chemotaxis protein [bacterium]